HGGRGDLGVEADPVGAAGGEVVGGHVGGRAVAVDDGAAGIEDDAGTTQVAGHQVAAGAVGAEFQGTGAGVDVAGVHAAAGGDADAVAGIGGGDRDRVEFLDVDRAGASRLQRQ